MAWLIDVLVYAAAVVAALLAATAVVFRHRFIKPWHKHEAERHDTICTRLDSRTADQEEVTRSHLARSK